MLLGIDTSGAVSVAIARASDEPGLPVEVLARRSDERARHHDEVLLGLVDEAVREAGIERSDLTGIVAGRGPGPFTGLRVGLVVARTIGAVLGIPVEGVCSLDALAVQIAADAPDARTIAVALDARRREVYWALYEVERDPADPRRATALRRLDGPGVALPADAAPLLADADARAGSGCALYPEVLPPTSAVAHVDAGALLEAAALLRTQGEDLASTEPMYLREPDAAKPTARKSALGL